MVEEDIQDLVHQDVDQDLEIVEGADLKMILFIVNQVIVNLLAMKRFGHLNQVIVNLLPKVPK